MNIRVQRIIFVVFTILSLILTSSCQNPEGSKSEEITPEVTPTDSLKELRDVLSKIEVLETNTIPNIIEKIPTQIDACLEFYSFGFREIKITNCDEENINDIIELTEQAAFEGDKIKSELSRITPPEEISFSYEILNECIDSQITECLALNEAFSTLNPNKGSYTLECALFEQAYKEINDYLNK